MSRTLTVKELIKELLECDMDADVSIGTGTSSYPSSGASIFNLHKGEGGVFIVPHGNLEEAP